MLFCDYTKLSESKIYLRLGEYIEEICGDSNSNNSDACRCGLRLLSGVF